MVGLILRVCGQIALFALLIAAFTAVVKVLRDRGIMTVPPPDGFCGTVLPAAAWTAIVLCLIYFGGVGGADFLGWFFFFQCVALVVCRLLLGPKGDSESELDLVQLKARLQSLAQCADVQLSLLPKNEFPADELADGFDNLFQGESKTKEFPAAGRQTLQEIDTSLAAISGKADFWTAEALRNHESWARIRELAKRALYELGWPNELPTRPI